MAAMRAAVSHCPPPPPHACMRDDGQPCGGVSVHVFARVSVRVSVCRAGLHSVSERSSVSRGDLVCQTAHTSPTFRESHATRNANCATDRVERIGLQTRQRSPDPPHAH